MTRYTLLLLFLTSCSPREKPSVIPRDLAARSAFPPSEAVACAQCHPSEFADWLGSQHARANRMVHRESDPAILAKGPVEAATAEAVIGITPLMQYLIPAPGGRLQALEWAYDPRSNEWFNVFGEENRQPGEWGHWTGRGNTWNVQCAFCHMTGFEKNYAPDRDTYASTWKAMGISCSQCHEVHDAVPVPTNTCPRVAARPAGAEKLARHMDTCASCHARREELFGTFGPGQRFEDHYRLVLPDTPGIFHPDGQVSDEDFEYASFMMSRMGHRGVTCMDCHLPHSGQVKFPVENNALCLQCHAPPGARDATPISETNHMFHAAGTPGGRCVDCHMPHNTYMARDQRRDHGFTSPDPRLTIELGVPNACNRCHTDQTPAWAETWTTRWYGDKMEQRRARQRARAVAAYHTGSVTAVTSLLALARSEEIAAWRAALVGMLAPWNAQPGVQAFLSQEVQNPQARVRSAALTALQGTPAETTLIPPLSTDSSTLVRVDAKLATVSSHHVPDPELLAYLRNIADQPAGAVRNAQVALRLNRTNEVPFWTSRIVAWDPSPGAFFNAGMLLHQANLIRPALSNLATAALGAPTYADYSYALALALAEAGNATQALVWLEETVRRDADFGRGWYNLGLAYAGAERLPEAIQALRRAEALMPDSPDPAYARASVHLRMKDTASAQEAARLALTRDPHHPPSLNLLRRLGH